MAYNYLGLVNDMCQRTNETLLTSSNFSTALGVYNNFKSAVNSSLNYINTREYEWPWNHTTQDDTLVAGTSRYSYQSDAKTVDFDTFRIQEDAALGNKTVHLKFIDYDEYIHRFVDGEYSTDTSIRGVPSLVTRAPDRQYILFPVPDKAYTLTYEYYILPTRLDTYSDAPVLPEIFRDTIVDGAMYYHYFMRNDIEAADRLWTKYSEGIDNLRKLFINNDYEYLRDTRLPNRNPYGTTTLRTN